MILPQKIFGSSVGRKAIMALTGAGLIGFVIIHLAGHMLMFVGPDAINSYALALKSNPLLLWSARLGLLLVFALHVLLAISLKLQNNSGRGPVGYYHKNTVQASLASRTMIWTGLLLLAFILFHLSHFTVFLVKPAYANLHDELGRHDVYSMMIIGFQNVPIGIGYIVAMLIMALHLSHGLPSIFQSMGWNSPRFDAMFRRIGTIFAVVMFFGYSALPVSVWLGILKLQ
jgi:succinate dehydrogenase / fumarate reductase cytochrome b subunit